MSARYCILGAGSSGLAVAKNFLQADIPFDCFERHDDVGGNWYYGKPGSSVYKSTHLISSKRLTEYTDFPMPENYPPYPSQQQAGEYLRSYARHFGLYERIEFGRTVELIEKLPNNCWQVRLESGESRTYDGIVIANGHNWDPMWPVYAGTFDGQILHSCQYKTPDLLKDKRVLVVGAGNSGCDIAVESAQHAAATFHSVRRGYHYLPKFYRGQPIDQLNERLLRWRLPLWLRRALASYAIKLAVGRPQNYGLPKPDHKLFETHPIINSQMLYCVGHGQIHPKPDIAELCGNHVKFVDGTSEEVDVLIYATGFRISFPFIDRKYLNWHDGRPHLFLNIFHPQDDTLLIAGLIQPDSGQWGLVDYQSQLIARYLLGLKNNTAVAARFRKQKASPPALNQGIRYLCSTRHLLEVEHFSYRERLKKYIRQLR